MEDCSPPSLPLPVPFVPLLPWLLLLPMLVAAVLFFLPLLLLSDSVIWMDKPPTRTRGIRRTPDQGMKLSSWKRRRTHSICVRSQWSCCYVSTVVGVRVAE